MPHFFRSVLLWFPPILFLQLPVQTAAQLPANPAVEGTLLCVRVLSPSGQAVGKGAHVRLQAARGATRDGYTDSSGEATFAGVEPGDFEVLVEAEGYEQTYAGSRVTDSAAKSQTFLVHMRPKGEPDLVVTSVNQTATVDLTLLKAPRKAVRELQAGTEFLTKRQWAKGAKHLEKAVAIYPEFALALNNLAVACAFLGDLGRERELLDRSLELNGRNAAALTNRAQVAIREQDLEGAEGFLQRAIALEPGNAQTLTVLAKVQLAASRFDAVLLSVRRIHALPHENYAMVHYLAARAYEARHDAERAAAELRRMLEEQPAGEWSPEARRELSRLEAEISLSRAHPNPQEEAARVR